MNREEAIAKLKEKRQIFIDEWADLDDIVEAFDMAITALSAPQTDLISRADAMRIVDSAIKAEIPFAIVADLIKGLPSADAVQGEWIFNAYEKTNKSWFECSVCGSDYFHKHNFCPNCGARMFREDGEE